MSTARSPILYVLMVEDSEDDVLLLHRQLQSAGYSVELQRVDTQPDLASALARQRWDIVFSDFSMPDFNGLEALKTVREHDPDLPFIIVSGTIGEERAVQFMKLGAQDYVIKGNIQRLLPAVARELKEAGLRREHRQAQERIRYLAYYDPLTDLPNRTHFLEQLAQRLDPKQSRHEVLTILALELSAYDEINTTLGYAAGDTLLRQAADRLQQLLPSGNTLAALGTARFAAMLSPSNLDYAHIVSEHLQQGFNQPFDIAGFRLSTGIHIGAAQYPEHGDEVQLLLRRAELALMLARRDPSAYAAYSSQTDPSNPERLRLATDLREAVDKGALELHFQPKIDLLTGRIEGAEALTRWQHPQKGMISPELFIPLAEQAGIIGSLTLWLLEAATRQQLLWRASGKMEVIPIAVNLSVRDLVDKRLRERFYGLLVDGHLQPGAIEIEITEGALMEDPEQSLKTLRDFQEMGIRIYVDDFGTGYSSLGYLQRLPIDAIKIDKSFVIDMIKDPGSASIVRLTVDLAHNLGLRVVAEGVENRATLQQLTKLGCDAAQGYFISPPLPSTEFLNWYESHPIGMSGASGGHAV